MSWLITPAQKTDPDALAYLAEVERADGQALESGVRDAVIAFVAGCKADGIWSAVKASCILAGARTLNGALVPLVGPAPINFNFVSGDYNRKTGLVGNRSNKYLDSGRRANESSVNNNHAAIYASSVTTNNGDSMLGASNSYKLFRSSSALYTNNHNSTSSGFPSSTLATGFAGMSRNSGSEYTLRNGGTTLTAARSQAVEVAENVFVFASPGASSNSRLIFYSLGDSLNLSLLDSRLATLEAALSAAIP